MGTDIAVQCSKGIRTCRIVRARWTHRHRNGDLRRAYRRMLVVILADSQPGSLAGVEIKAVDSLLNEPGSYAGHRTLPHQCPTAGADALADRLAADVRIRNCLSSFAIAANSSSFTDGS